MTKITMKNVVMSGNHGHGAVFQDVESLDIDGGDFSNNRLNGLTVRTTVAIPEEMARAIRTAVADGQSMEQIGGDFGDGLAKLGVPIAQILAVAANGTQLLEYLNITL